jgi:hypothetical protein
MDLSAASSGHGSASSPNSHPSLTGQDDIEIDDIECDDPQGENSLVVEEQNQKVRENKTKYLLHILTCFGSSTATCR